MARLPITKQLRFEILKRDGFKCHYCGNTARVRPLHVDHVKPVIEGGTNEPDNLVACCSDCNVGKHDTPLEEIKINPEPVPDFPKVPRRKYPAETFRLFGRRYRVFKRVPGGEGNWYFYFEKSKKRWLTSLRTNCPKTAVEKAKLMIEAEFKGQMEEMRALITGREPKPSVDYCPVARYLELYESTATGENTPDSRKKAVQAFRRVAVGKLPATMADLEPMFRSARDRVNINVENCDNNTQKMSFKRSFNSELASAASVFSELAVFHLKDKLTLPDFSELRALVKFLRFPDAKKTSEQYNPPPAAVLTETIRTWLELPRNEFLAVGLALACGMRRGEIKDFADWSWFEEHAGYLWANARQGDFKDRTDVLRTQVLDPFWSMLLARATAEGWRPAEGRGLVIQGNRSEFDRHISEWMKRLGWNTRLHLHALRAWSGSLVYMQYGAAAACAFCRHTDEKTTRQHYAWMKQDWHTAGAAVLVAGRPVEWVKAK